MNNLEAKSLVDEIFSDIQKSNSIKDLISILDNSNIEKKFKMDSEKYPKIEFSLSAQEIQELIDKEILNDDFKFSNDLSKKINDPLTKLLYATIWKKGDLIKIKHISKGIMSKTDDLSNQNDAFVFYQFGKYLTKSPEQPIIDQHVLRAFGIYTSSLDDTISTYRKMDAINKSRKQLILDYKAWLTSDSLSQPLRECREYSYHIDQILFAVGKYVKIPKSKR